MTNTQPSTAGRRGATMLIMPLLIMWLSVGLLSVRLLSIARGAQLPAAALDAADEAELATAIEAGLLAAEARRNRSPVQASQAELIMLERIGERAANRFVESNLRLVAMVVRKVAVRSRMSENELFQEGCVGLLEAVRRFDHRRGPRFATYALHWIRAYVGALSANRGGELNLPPSRAGRLREIHGIRARLAQELGRAVTVDELAVEVGQRPEWITRLLSSGQIRPMDSDQLAELELPDEAAAEELEAVLSDDIPGPEVLAGLDELLRRVVEMRYGFGDGRQHSLREIGAELALPVSTIRRLELRALDELRAVYPQQARAHL